MYKLLFCLLLIFSKINCQVQMYNPTTRVFKNAIIQIPTPEPTQQPEQMKSKKDWVYAKIPFLSKIKEAPIRKTNYPEGTVRQFKSRLDGKFKRLPVHNPNEKLDVPNQAFEPELISK